jgi:hypothetical protein
MAATQILTPCASTLNHKFDLNPPPPFRFALCGERQWQVLLSSCLQHLGPFLIVQGSYFPGEYVKDDLIRDQWEQFKMPNVAILYTDLHVRITATIISYSFLPFELVYGLLISAHQEDWLLVGLEMIHVLHQGEQGTD